MFSNHGELTLITLVPIVHESICYSGKVHFHDFRAWNLELATYHNLVNVTKVFVSIRELISAIKVSSSMRIFKKSCH